MIWFKPHSIESLKHLERSNMLAHLGIELLKINDDSLIGRMPVDNRTTQPMGILHGGASAALAESLGSIAANLVIDDSLYYVVGTEITANHLKPVKEGYVYGTAQPIHIGKTTQLWQIKITNEQQQLVCIAKLMVINMKKIS